MKNAMDDSGIREICGITLCVPCQVDQKDFLLNHARLAHWTYDG